MGDQLAKEVRALRSEARPAWSRIGQLLDAVESSRYWERERAASFTEWLRALAHSLGRKERIFWRYLAAARYYQQLWAQLKQRNFDAPALAELPDSVSPGHIELLSRLARAAPPEVVESLAKRVVAREITRAELQQAWQAFRPALGGRTARGRGAVKPRIDRLDPQQREDLLRARVLHALQSSDTFWTGYIDPDRYEVLLEIRCEPVSDHPSGCMFDAVAAVQRKRGPVLLHGIEYVGAANNEVTQLRIQQAAAYCDYLWVARHEEAGTVDVEWIPEKIGLLLVKGGRLEVVRPARRISREARYREVLAQALLRVLLPRAPQR